MKDAIKRTFIAEECLSMNVNIRNIAAVCAIFMCMFSCGGCSDSSIQESDAIDIAAKHILNSIGPEIDFDFNATSSRWGWDVQVNPTLKAQHKYTDIAFPITIEVNFNGEVTGMM
jgi:hypothetical protein